jgi:hypothetical protein
MLPEWAEEAGASAFSGELQNVWERTSPQEEESLRQAVSRAEPLTLLQRRTIGKLVARFGWPDEPCRVSTEIADILTGSRAQDRSFVVMDARSARVLERGGDVAATAPPGSLLKIPYVAALRGAHPATVGNALLTSDVGVLARLRNDLHEDIYHLLVSPFGGAVNPIGLEPPVLMGERAPDRTYPFVGDLRSVALMVRAALLLDPGRFIALKENGVAEASTLYPLGRTERDALHVLGGIAKTGTASDAHGVPLWGHVVLAWPAENPTFIAVMRRRGARGAEVLAGEVATLHRWAKEYTRERWTARVRLLEKVAPSERGVSAECALLTTFHQGQTSLCGELIVSAVAPRTAPIRTVQGIVVPTPGGLLLETDVETYADGVMQAEAATLRGEAAKSLRTIVVWNALHGRARHPDDALCATTHCMAFLGSSSGFGTTTDRDLLGFLVTLALGRKERWFMFSKGGKEPWSRELEGSLVAGLVGEEVVLDLRVHHGAAGEPRYRLTYPDHVEEVPCTLLAARLKLPSCPLVVRSTGSGYRFEGAGEGHPFGLDLSRAVEGAARGLSARALLEEANRLGAQEEDRGGVEPRGVASRDRRIPGNSDEAPS